MTRLGADATSETIAELKALGATFVSRYVSDFPAKNLTLAEAQRLTDAGIDIVTNWENDVNDWQGGYNQGVAYARKALGLHIACGGRTDEAYPYWGIYFSADMEIDPDDPRLHAYYDGTRSVLGVHHNGAYAQTSVLRRLRSLGLIGCGQRGGTWRSMSTFGLPEGLGNPGEFDVEQVGQYSAKYDKNVANSANFGQWRVGVTLAATPKEFDMSLLINVSGSPAVYKQDGLLLRGIQDGTSVTAYKGAGIPEVTVTAKELASLQADTAALVAKLGATVVMTDAQAESIGAAIAAKLPKTITLTGTETVSETGTLG